MKYKIFTPNLESIWNESIKWKPNEEEKKVFDLIHDEIIAGNKELNLTRITDEKDFWEKHLWDSLSVIEKINNLYLEKNNINAIDIGTGAGFPGIPVAIANPSWQITLLDATRKKINFLQSLVEKLEIKNIQTLIGRAETIAKQKQYREFYDIALVRAVGKPSVCAEYALPFLKIGGMGILYRGNWTTEEQDSLDVAASQLGGKILSIAAFTTPLTNSIRHCVYLEKISPTPIKFPRGVGIPSQNPL